MDNRTRTKIINFMFSLNEKSEYDKYNLLNNIIFIKLLFSNPVNVNRIQNTEYNLKTVSSADANSVVVAIIELMKYNEQYLKFYVKFNFNNNSNQLPYNIHNATHIKKISRILDDNCIDHCVNINLHNETEQTSMLRKKSYNFDMQLIFDIFGVLIFNTNTPLVKKVASFVIMFVNDENDLYTNISNCVYAECMNINILFLNVNDKTKFVTEIKQFFKNIKSGNYVRQNGPRIPKKYYTSKYVKQFVDAYNYNHNIYLKYHKNKIIDDEYEPDIKLSKPPNDKTYVEKQFFDQLTKSKYVFTTGLTE